jgi:IMP dehydrogenase
MDSITGAEMLVAMSQAGGLGILTRYINHKDELKSQQEAIRWARDNGAKHVGCAVGIRKNVYDTAKSLLDEGCEVICLDVAHGDHVKMYLAIEEINALRGQYVLTLVAGNVCTPEAAIRFADAGVDAVKVGIGPGAACTTRLVTGFGVPQLSAIQECASKLSETECCIIADGGLRTSGDMVKALWAGANCCMIGWMLAGTSNCPDLHGAKMYRGMSSRSASGREDIAPEGIEISVEYKGNTEEKMAEYVKGLRSGLAMGGASNIKALRQCDYVRVTPLSVKETHPM